MTASVSSAFEDRAEGRVARLVINEERRLNVLNSAQLERLMAALEPLAGDESLRVVVLTGAGRSFIGGADLGELKDFDRELARGFITRLHEVCAAIRALPVPVIGRINGYCLGGGLEVAAACDMRVAGESAVFGMPEVKVGLPSVIEAALLPGLIGWGKTREILLTGETFGADEARRIGFVEWLVVDADLDAAVESWVESICANGPHAVRTQKALITTWEKSSLEAGIEAGVDALADAYLTDEPTRLMKAFFDQKGAKG
jgi:enoyl-CoA hydratase/carnithine racemase